MTPATDAAREAIARVIDAPIWNVDSMFYHASDWETRRAAALSKADSILALTEAASQPREGDGRTYPELLSSAEQKAVLERAERLWKDLQANNLGGFSGINRPFYIVAEFKSVIEQFGHRDVGLRWSKDDLDAAALTQRPPEQAGAVPAGVAAVAGRLARRMGAEFVPTAPTPPDAGPGEREALAVSHIDYCAADDWLALQDRYDPAKSRDSLALSMAVHRFSSPAAVAIHGIADDYMTSDEHHPGYVLIPVAKFEHLRTVAGILAGGHTMPRTDNEAEALTPKAPPQTPPDAGIGSDGAGERV